MLFDKKLHIVGFENLHLHTAQGSILDGFGNPEEYTERALIINQDYLCVTDHGTMNSVPRIIKSCEKSGIKPCFGIEFYVNDCRVPPNEIKNLSPEERSEASTCYHLLAIAYSDLGMKNLITLCSLGYENFYRKPRVNHDQLRMYREGIIFTSCCYNSEIGRAFDRGGTELAEEKLKIYLEMFRNNFYLEIMLLDFHKQKLYDLFIISMKEKYNLPIILTNDCHYCNKDDSYLQMMSIMIKTRKTLKDVQDKVDNGEDVFELQDKNLWMKSEEELNEKYLEIPSEKQYTENPLSKLSYSEIIPLDVFEAAKKQTVDICRMAEGVKINRDVKLPQIKDAEEKLQEAILCGFRKKGLLGNKKYINRVGEELSLIKRKGYCSYFLIEKMFCDEAKKQATAIGLDSDFAINFGRGSCVSSLICFLLGITKVDPIKHDLLFFRFLNESRGGDGQIKTRFLSSPLN